VFGYEPVHGRTTKGVEEVAWEHDVAEAEIGDLDLTFFRQENVLELQVSMNHQVSMTILKKKCSSFRTSFHLVDWYPYLESGDHLAKERASFVLSESSLLNDVIEQLTAIDLSNERNEEG